MRALTGDPLLRVRSLSKTFPGLTALDGVNLTVHSGEIVALVGQNGSGKSTLVKTLAGLYSPDPGSVIELIPRAGESEQPPRLYFIHQDLGLIPTLSAVENLDLGKPHRLGGLLPTHARRERRHARELIAELGASIEVDEPVQGLSASERAIIAIVRALDGWEGRRHVLVLDEPTAALPSQEAEKLFSAVRGVAAQGAGVVFISHHLDEVMQLADRVVALRGGRVVADEPIEDVDRASLVRMIVGQELSAAESSARELGDVALQVVDLYGEEIDGVSLEVRAGEIVGVTGILGSGREELASLIFGQNRPHAGTIRVHGRPLAAGRPRASIAAGVGFVPADRPALGAVMTLTAKENLTLPALRTVTGVLGWISRRGEARDADAWAGEVELEPRNVDRPLTLFSGGNQQKIVLAKWLRTSPKVLLLDEPSQGVDVGAKAALYGLISRSAEAGAAVLVSSSDTEELVALCDRVLVMRDGLVVTEVAGADLTEEALLADPLSDSARFERSGSEK
ncbi:sugar ABC transporter ATP-binding protein [Microbacterium timonense]|uniref:sugar ABC transporter ATP-binding protein n=1 Tax=Microbacterium timonense TaxID=2086576 RepID=UPI000D113B49|nr:sugar ABC transporter ATP-binding protein [Microbacterium timonense]